MSMRKIRTILSFELPTVSQARLNVWQTRTLYDETTYLNALRKRGSPLLKNLDLG